MSPETVPLNDAVEMIVEPVLVPEGQCEHVLALHLDPRPDCPFGVLRCIVSREGDVAVHGYIDRSLLLVVDMHSKLHLRPTGTLQLYDPDEVFSALTSGHQFDCLGFEDPIIWYDDERETVHLYFTIPIRRTHTDRMVMHLGHAYGPDIYSLRMTEPVLSPVPSVHGGAKEVTVAPINSDGVRRNLVESNDTMDGESFSVVRSTIVRSMGDRWEYDEIVLHPAMDGYEWCAKHVSPGPFFPREFLDVGENRLVGLLNGRETDRSEGDRLKHGTFSIGLMIYNYETGEVEWISKRPFIVDPDARTITFASDFLYEGGENGIVYAHVDDSYIRAYSVDAQKLRDHLPVSIADQPSG